MSDVIAAGRYARALFELAEKENNLAEIDAGLVALAATLVAEPKIPLLMANPTLTDPEKYGLMLKTLRQPQGLLERFLRVVIEKKRFELLPEVQRIFHDRFEKKLGVQEVEMISPVAFSSAFLDKLKTLLTKKLRSEIRLIPKTNRDLLGGFVLRFAGKEVDCSFKNRLHEIQQKLSSSAQEGTV